MAILDGNMALHAGSFMSPTSAAAAIFHMNPNGVNTKLAHEDAIDPSRLNIKATLEIIAEGTNQGNNSRIAAEIALLDNLAQDGFVIHLEKGAKIEKIAAKYVHKLPDGSFSIEGGQLREWLNYSFADAAKTLELAPAQNGIVVS
jgi:hypothetical protein